MNLEENKAGHVSRAPINEIRIKFRMGIISGYVLFFLEKIYP